MSTAESSPQQQHHQHHHQFRPKDFFSFLTGFWKRNLEWRDFGGPFSFIRTTNTVVHVEEQQLLIGEPNLRHLKWSFGSTMSKKDLRFGYVMRVLSAHDTPDLRLEWEYVGVPCHGEYIAATSVAILNFFQKNSTVTVTYRILDPDTMAICVVEAEAGKPAILQFGNMMRIDPDLYAKFGAAPSDP